MSSMPSSAGRILAVAAAGAVTVSALTSGAAAATATAKALPCRASMSNNRPKDYTTTDVRVHSASRAHVTTVAHYRTTKTTHHATAGSKGNATIAYHISGATPGYKVTVSVSVTKGSRAGHCSTSFIPHR
jgi:hypothetical protein